MGLFSTTPPAPVEDHGSDLLAELATFHEQHAERVDRRRSVVVSRLAALEAEHADLAETDRRLHALGVHQLAPKGS